MSAAVRVMGDDGEVAYRWEQSEVSWESVREDDQGNIISASSTEKDRSLRAKKRKVTAGIRRGLIRYLTIAIDCSASAEEKDYRPCRLEMVKAAVDKFIRDYFDQNPISQLSIIKTADRVAKVVTNLSGNPKNHRAELGKIYDMKGDASLQNLLLLSMESLVHVPDYGTREVLVIYNSLKTRDPGDIFETIRLLKAHKIRVSVICTAAELYICKRITVETHGAFDVSMDSNHFNELICQHSTPPAELQSSGELSAEFVYMGFPKRVFTSFSTLATTCGEPELVTAAYVCPRCYTKTCEIPTQCKFCGLQLNSSTHIARSYHHLFPVPNFTELMTVPSAGSSAQASPYCEGCLQYFAVDALRSQCPKCSKLYCVDCDAFIHDSLHNCPECCDSDVV